MVLNQQTIPNDRYQVIPRTLIFPRNKSKILLLKGAADKKLWANLYNGIGGHIERGEDILTAAYRELMEETGIQKIELFLCGTILIDSGHNPGICIFVFTGECQEYGLKHSPEGDLSWIEIDFISDLELVADIPILIPRVYGWKPGMPPFSALYSSDSKGELVITFAN